MLKVVSAGPERINDMEPLWRAMYAHHLRVSPVLRRSGSPGGADDLWPAIRRRHEAWLAEPHAFARMAEQEGRAIGYAIARLRERAGAWEPPGPIGVLEVLTVAEGSRSLGVGSQLMEAVRRELARLGAGTLELRVLAGNDEAMRFYERHGLRPVRVVFMGPVAVDEEGAVRAD
jgi:GNAT superfamily N-acetyltransferase